MFSAVVAWGTIPDQKQLAELTTVSLLVSSADVHHDSNGFVITAIYAAQTGMYCGGQLTADLLSGLRAQSSRGFKSRHLRPDQAKRRRGRSWPARRAGP